MSHLQAGKALEKRCTEIRIQLRPIAQSFYPEEDLSENELVIIVCNVARILFIMRLLYLFLGGKYLRRP